ncbi:MAG: DNA internalization-related competence protein ComEC/Rec2 [Gammaproteobacteria bacterium]|nr:DNA internalization-related competence protein ComEC/Rec2 [Gammaproteobacteria bacterium]
MPQHALAILMGALIAFYGNRLPDPFWSAYAPALLLLACCCCRYRFVFLLAAAFLWSSALLHHHLSHRLLDSFDNRSLLLSGVIADIPQLYPGRINLFLKDLRIDAYPAAMPRLARFSWYQNKRIPRAGERWQFVVKIRQPRGMLNPAGFDYEAWQFVRAIDATGYIRESTRNRRLESASVLDLNYWRSGLAANIDRDCGRCRHLGLIKALALGFRGDIGNHSRRLLQHSGTAHLLAISGLHIGMVSLMFYVLGGYVWRLGIYRCGLNRRTLASLCALLAALAYAALAGFSLPTLRALLMFAVVLIALQLKSKINLLQAIALALALILLADPLTVGSISLWLSFGALMVIAFMQFRFPAKMKAWRQLLVLQVYFIALFAPVGVLIFGQLNLAGLPANLVAIPLLSFVILPVVLAACLLSALGLGGASLLFAIADRVLGFLLDYLAWLIASGLQSLAVYTYPPILLLLALAVIAILLSPRLAGARGIAALILAALLLWQPARLEHGEYELIVLDIGMGTSLLLKTRHHSLVYDFGPGGHRGFNAAEAALLPAMRLDGIDAADLYIVSHVDHDHSGGLYSFLGNYPPARLLSGTPRELRAKFELPHRVRSCHGYPDWRWDGVLFRFLETGAPPGDSTNNRSCVLQVTGYQRALLPGDIEIEQETRLVDAYGDRLAADILVAPHHGSGTSSSRPFLRRVNPSHVVFTVARNNRWDFPDALVIVRYRELGSRLYRSDRDGAVTITSRSGAAAVKSERNPPRRIWRRW